MWTVEDVPAVAAVFDAVRAGALTLVRSPAHDFENDRNPREDRRLATRLWLDVATMTVTAVETTGSRARELAALSFGPLVSRPGSLVSIEGGEAPGPQGARRKNTLSI